MARKKADTFEEWHQGLREAGKSQSTALKGGLQYVYEKKSRMRTKQRRSRSK